MAKSFYESVNNPFGGEIFHFEEITSTMDIAKESCQVGAIFIANHQTSGRGRFPSRQWRDIPNQNLLFTLVLPIELFGNRPTSLLAGLALVRILKQEGLSPQIKWPNDVLVNGAKLAGILVQIHNERLLLGMGINLNQEDFSGVEIQATSLRLLLGRKIEKYKFLQNFLYTLYDTLTDFTHWNKEVNQSLWAYDQLVDYYTGVSSSDFEKVTGRIIAVQEDGGLQVATKNGQKVLYSGETRVNF